MVGPGTNCLAIFGKNESAAKKLGCNLVLGAAHALHANVTGLASSAHYQEYIINRQESAYIELDDI